MAQKFIPIAVVKGLITEQTTDAIVNSVGDEFDLSVGALSRSILKAAGEEIQLELNSNKKSDVLYGDVTTTNGCDLPCHYVFHGVLKEWNDTDAKEILQIFIRNCLLEADRRRLSSIAFPAVGTGVLGYPGDLVADCLFKEADKFGSSNPNTSIKKIRFVAYEKDQKTFEIFQAKLNQIKRKSNVEEGPLRDSAYPGSPGNLPGKQYGMARLDSGDAEYKMVLKRVKDTMGNASIQSIVKIEKIENPTLRQFYAMNKKVMEQKNDKHVENERILWHGTAKESITNICNDGFNRSYCGKNAFVFGKGVYFARDFEYSTQSQYSKPDVTGTKYIFMCKVLTGTFTVGDKNTIEPKMKPETDIRHDSTVDDLNNPSVFVIFKDAQAYPEYLVAFN